MSVDGDFNRGVREITKHLNKLSKELFGPPSDFAERLEAAGQLVRLQREQADQWLWGSSWPEEKWDAKLAEEAALEAIVFAEVE
jgi:predicted amidohydrolase YtcJ